MVAIQDQARRNAFVVEDLGETRQWLNTLLRTAFGEIDIANAVDLKSARHWFSGRDTEPLKLLALIDLGLPDGSGIDLIRELREAHPTVQLVVTTVFDDDTHLVQAMAAGAHGYLLKDRDTDELVTQLRKIDGGEPAISPAVARRILELFRAHAMFIVDRPTETHALTPRETDVLTVIGRGLTLPEAALVLGMSGQTVATHVKTIYRKLGIRSRAEAAREAIRLNLT